MEYLRIKEIPETCLNFARILPVAVIFLIVSNKSTAQVITDRIDISFGIEKWDPVHVKVEEKTGSAFSTPIRFTALNSTYYPFMLAIEFIQFENLSPRPAVRPIEVSHGSNNLYTFSIQVPGTGYGYRYKYGYWLKGSDKDINKEFPYLIPLKEGTTVNSKKRVACRVSDSFAGNAGDTVYCMRRGLVTAVPRTETMDFRISGYDCLEVLHADGTYMIYHNLDKSDSFTAPGRVVITGQPIGRISDSSFLQVTLLKCEDSNNLMFSQTIRYVLAKSGTASFDDIDGTEKSVFPRDIIVKELRGKELKQSQKKK